MALAEKEAPARAPYRGNNEQVIAREPPDRGGDPVLNEIDPSRFVNLRIEHHDDGVSVVTLNRPAKRNALDVATIDELTTLFTLAPRAGVRAVVLCGAGDHFCAGLDLIEHHRADRSPSEFWQAVSYTHLTLPTILRV